MNVAKKKAQSTAAKLIFCAGLASPAQCRGLFAPRMGESSRFWKDYAFVVARVQSWRRAKAARGVSTKLARLKILAVLAAEKKIAANLNAEVAGTYGQIGSHVGPIRPGGTFILLIGGGPRQGWAVSGNVSVPDIMPAGMQSWPVTGLSDPLVRAVLRQIKRKVVGADGHLGRHPVHVLAKLPTTMGRLIHYTPKLAQGYTVESGTDAAFWKLHAVVVLRVRRRMADQYIASDYPPAASVVSARVVLTVAADIPVPSRLHVGFFREKATVGTVLPPLSLIKPGAMFMAVISTPAYFYHTPKEPPRIWLIEPNMPMSFMPGQLALVPISGLRDSKVRQTEIKVMAAERRAARRERDY